ncbi:small multidrug resistance family-3 protein [Orbus hercynius]|uniref:Small multidrug resistance family-3 protein n=1 Tax=Orbus hercynius TaxID=593135 RepID=A0A495RJ73_9GAMM|nr:YnfA family protein [Orbus hercynius]RKS87593.1 small multidrug resistance family-3 protein [Orbus hercynius]
MIKIIGLFILTALTEILGCYFVYIYLKKAASTWCLTLAALSLMAFAWLLTLHPEASGRIYATYGGIYIVVSLIWLRVVDNVKLSSFDFVGAAIILLGTAIIISGWRAP